MTEFLRANVTVMVTDLDRALDFYVGCLDLKLIARYGEHWAEVEGPGIVIGLHPSDKPIIRGENLQIALGVEDLETAITNLTEKGVSFLRSDEPAVRLASFRDPDGNTLYLVQARG